MQIQFSVSGILEIKQTFWDYSVGVNLIVSVIYEPGLKLMICLTVTNRYMKTEDKDNQEAEDNDNNHDRTTTMTIILLRTTSPYIGLQANAVMNSGLLYKSLHVNETCERWTLEAQSRNSQRSYVVDAQIN